MGTGLRRPDLVEEAAARVRQDYSAAAEGRSAVLSSSSAEPGGSAMLAQTVFADDYRGATVAFGGEIRAEDVAGQASLRLEILRKGWRIPGGPPDGAYRQRDRQPGLVQAGDHRDGSRGNRRHQVRHHAGRPRPGVAQEPGTAA